jgi:putative CocE/NonD family hydrolase
MTIEEVTMFNIIFSATSILMASSTVSSGTVHNSLQSLLPPSLTACSPDPSTNVAAERSSLYVPSFDGTRLAVDVFLPKTRASRQRFPAIYTLTRYWRGKEGDDLDPVSKQWLAHGYAIVIADARGTGASFGQWYMPWMPPEVQDIGTIANWIATQPWSNGKVAATGNSYPGSTSQLSPAFGTPAIKAIVPRSVAFDLYTDLLAPGGVIQEDLWTRWGKLTSSLDRNEASPLIYPAGGSVRPVDGVEGPALLQAALGEHAQNPWSFDKAAYQMIYDDQPLNQYGGWPYQINSPYIYTRQIEASNVPIFSIVSWMDAGTAQGTLNRFNNWTLPQTIIIGAWTHGSTQDADPYHTPHHVLDPPLDDQRRWFFCFMDASIGPKIRPNRDRTIVYYTMGADRWNRTNVWPIPEAHPKRLYLGAHNALRAESAASSDEDRYDVDFSATVGTRNRWSTQTGSPVEYGDRAEADKKLLTYDSEPLASDIEVTGSGVVNLRLSTNQVDGAVFAYVEDIAPDGRVTYVTEGELRMLHRKLSISLPYKTPYPSHSFSFRDGALMIPGQAETLTFQLLPTSALFKAGHRIRLAIAGADKGNFLRVPPLAQGPETFAIKRGNKESFIELPIVDP